MYLPFKSMFAININILYEAIKYEIIKHDREAKKIRHFIT